MTTTTIKEQSRVCLARKCSAVKLEGLGLPRYIAVSPTCRHGYEGFVHLSSMHAGDGEYKPQRLTGQAINNACLGRTKREHFLGSSLWRRILLVKGFLDS